MPANVEVNSTTAAVYATIYPQIAFQTEDAGRSSYVNSFHYAQVGSSTYSFGVYQFDVGGNGSARSFLTSNGFTSDQVNELSQQGGISSSELSSLNSQLQTVLGSSSGSASYQNLVDSSTQGYITGLQTTINDASSTISSAILSDSTAVARVLDIENQFGGNTLAALHTFVGGDAATPPGGDTIQWDYSKNASTNLESFFYATYFGGVPSTTPGGTSPAVTRDNAFYSAVQNNPPPGVIVDISTGTGSDANVANLPNLSGVTVRLDSGTSVTLSGTANNDTLVCANTTANITSVSGSQNFQCSVSDSGNGTITDTGSGVTVSVGPNSQLSSSGSNDTIDGTSGDNLLISGSADTIAGSGMALVDFASNAGQATLIGDSNQFQGSVGDAINVQGTNNVGTGSGASIDFSNNSATNTFSGSYNTISLGASATFTDLGDNNVSFDSGANGGEGSSITNEGSGGDVSVGGGSINFVQGSFGAVFGSNNSLLDGTGVSVSVIGDNDTFKFNNDGNGGGGTNLLIDGNNNDVSESQSSVTYEGSQGSIAGSNNDVDVANSSSVSVTGSSDTVTAESNGVNIAAADGTTVYVPSSENNITITGNDLTIMAGSNDGVTLDGSGDTVNGGSQDNFAVSGDDDGVHASDSTVDFSNGDTGDDVYGSGDSGSNWDNGYGGGGGGGDGGYGGYGGYAFSGTPTTKGIDIGHIASTDVKFGTTNTAVIAQAARLQAEDAVTGGVNASAVSLEGVKWNKRVVTWSLAAAPGGGGSSTLNDATFEQDVQNAFLEWAKVSGIQFKEVSGASSADIRVGWGDFDTATSGVLGYTTTKAYDGSILSEAIKLENPNETPLSADANGELAYAGTNAELPQLLLHEIGHALGFADSTDSNSIMAATLTASNRTLDLVDGVAAQALYATKGQGAISDVAAFVSGQASNANVTTISAAGLRAQAQQLLQASASFAPSDMISVTEPASFEGATMTSPMMSLTAKA